MPVTLSIKNAPDDVVRRLRLRAGRNHRSLQGELMTVMEAAVGEPKPSTLQVLAEVRRLGITTPDEPTAILHRRLDPGRDPVSRKTTRA